MEGRSGAGPPLVGLSGGAGAVVVEGRGYVGLVGEAEWDAGSRDWLLCCEVVERAAGDGVEAGALLDPERAERDGHHEGAWCGRERREAGAGRCGRDAGDFAMELVVGQRG